MQQEQTGQIQATGSAPPGLAESLDIIHEFLDAFPAEHLEEHSWELIWAAMISEEANDWSARDRSNMLQLYKQLSKLGYALATVNKTLWPLGRLREEELK